MSNRQGDYVRRLQLSALTNCGEECDEEVIRVVTAMRKEQRPVDPDTRGRIFSRYYFRLEPEKARMTRFVKAVPPEEHIATFRWLFDNADLADWQSVHRSYYLAVLQEAAGYHDGALAGYRSIRSLVAGQRGWLLDGAGRGSSASRGDECRASQLILVCAAPKCEPVHTGNLSRCLTVRLECFHDCRE